MSISTLKQITNSTLTRLFGDVTKGTTTTLHQYVRLKQKQVHENFT